MEKISAGILLYRFRAGFPEVLLVHPGGPYHVHKDLGSWSIPKGIPEDNEASLAAAQREFHEETGMQLATDKFLVLSPVRQKGGKTVHAWAAEGDFDPSGLKSNTFRMEYPYRSGKWIDVAEVDRAEWFSPGDAKQKINPGQVPLIDELLELLK